MVAQIVATNQISVKYTAKFNQLCCWMPGFVVVMLCQCSVTITMFCNNVSVIVNHYAVTDYMLLDFGEIVCNKYPVLLL